MAHATVGYCFTGDPENGGEGVLVGLHRCQAFKVALRKHVGQDGNNYNKGDVIAADCNVTGTDVGTPSKPKFPLKSLWEYILIPALEALVAPGGRCEGAIVVHQEDNAGPHKEGNYHTWLKVEFESRGWKLELQAPQVPKNHSLTLMRNLVIVIFYLGSTFIFALDPPNSSPLPVGPLHQCARLAVVSCNVEASFRAITVIQ